MLRIAKRLLPSRVRRVLSEYIGRREGLADITPLESIRHTLEQAVPTVWIDVGAYRGNMTFPWARRFSSLTVYAFEPNLRLAARLSGRLRNYVVIPAAIAEHDGMARFFVTRFPASSSLLPLNAETVQRLAVREKLQVVEQIAVPTMRLETFMDAMNLSTVDFLKVDAQGGDLAVIASAGNRLRDISRVVCEVSVTSDQVYAGAATKPAALAFMRRNGFQLLHAETQYDGNEENLTFGRAISPPSRRRVPVAGYER